MPLETQKPQGQEEQLYTPPGPQPIVFEDFSGGLNTNSTRPGIKENELWWSDGFFPIAPNYLRTIPDAGTAPIGSGPGSILYDVANSPSGGGKTPILWIAGQSCEVLGFSLTARDNDPPVVNIQGDATMLTGPLGNGFSGSDAVVVDSDQNIYVIGGYDDISATWQNNAAVFPKGSNGNAPPSQFISGASTTLGNEQVQAGICIDADRNIYIGISQNHIDSTLMKFDRGATGDVAPTTIASLAGDAITSIFFDATNQWIWVLTWSLGGSTGSVYAFDLNGAMHVHINGASTTLDSAGSTSGLQQVILDSARNIYVAGQFGASPPSVVVFAAGSDGNVAPLRSFGNTANGHGSYNGIAIDADGNAYLSAIYSGMSRIEIMPASSTGATSPTGVMTNSALTMMDTGDATQPEQLFIG